MLKKCKAIILKRGFNLNPNFFFLKKKKKRKCKILVILDMVYKYTPNKLENGN